MKTNFQDDITLEELEYFYNMCSRFITAGYEIDTIFKRGILTKDGQKFECGITLCPIVLSESHEVLDEN